MDTLAVGRYTGRMGDVAAALGYLRERGFGGVRPRVALILGSGFGLIEREVLDPVAASYADIPGFPPPAGTSGHQCRLTQGSLWDVPALVFRGRYHAYEGHAPHELALCVQVAHALGADTLVVTNAAGGIREDLQSGSLMAISDHINLMGVNPLIGPTRLEGAKPFPAMGGAYDAALTDALARGQVARGVYAGVLGPSFETPAEVEMLRRLGADAVGMSTVPEVITARALGMRVCGLSLITNRAGGSDDSHEGTLKAGGDNAARVASVLKSLFGELGPKPIA
ncbi:MAG: purine-nucleoside phosphorylase [Planctomycetes bacterium]|nr:purine-nucleoside phosphorylase [Planctomycetota bacterium]